jgi:hypothetical protein
MVEKPVKKHVKPPEYEWAYIAKPIVILRAPRAATKGQGEGSTK